MQPWSFQTEPGSVASPKVSVLGPQKLWCSVDARCKRSKGDGDYKGEPEIEHTLKEP